MKKLIISITLFVLCISALCISGGAAGDGGEVVALSVQTYPTKTVYGAFEEFDPAGMTLRAVYSDGSERIINAERAGILYQRDDRLRVGDSYVIVSFGGARTTVPVTVNRISYDLSVLDLSSFSVTYNGKYQSYSQMLPTVMGQDGIPLVMSAVGGSVDAGSYDIRIDFHTESKDYITPDTRVVTMTVLPYTPELVWEEQSFTYDGKSKLPRAYYYDVNGNKLYATVTGAAINAGVYTARATVPDPNYLIQNPEASYEIKRATYDFSGVKWSEDSFVYDGGKKSISASGLPSGVKIIGYTGDRAVNAGKYTATASLSWDKLNYNTPEELSHSWEILPATYDMSMTVFADSEFVFDGQTHYPRLEGRMPTGMDGITLKYSFSAGATHVSEGVVKVTVSFTTDSKNYILPDSVSATVKINPKGITVIWGESEIFYNGEYNHPTVSAPECDLTVEGGGVNVGSYRATARSGNSDYYLLNDKMDFVIKKAHNSWKSLPDSAVCYEGKEISLGAEAAFGTVNYIFYSDADGENRISSPTACGVYYARLFVSETDNYTALESGVIPFEIVKIVPVTIEVKIDEGRLKAFETLGIGDFLCWIVNNDGSREAVDTSLVRVVYQNGNSFTRADSTVNFIYGEYRISMPIEVGYADYDLSGVTWQEIAPEYDGTPKTPYLAGLPEGVRVVEYIGGGVTPAGKYTVTAVLEYDSQNYNVPIIPPCNFEIRKCLVEVPVITAVYNGKGQIPLSSCDLYEIIYSGEYTNAGDYSITARLRDSDNYTFGEGTNGECEAIFTVLPKTVSITLSDTKKYLFEGVGEANYTLNTEDILPGESLTVKQYIEGNRIYAYSENSNYTLSVTPGKIIRLWYPSGRGAALALLILLIISAITAVGVLGYKNREKIAEGFAILRCRWHNRAVAVFPPKEQYGQGSKSWNIPPAEREAENESKAQSTDEIEKPVDTTDEASVAQEGYAEGIPPEEMDAEEPTDPTEQMKIEIAPTPVNVERADSLITDSLAKNLIKRDAAVIYTSGSGRSIVNVDTLSESFAPGERVDVNALKERGIVSKDTAFLKVLARGSIDKPMSVYANDFSLSAVKMIALTGGEAIKVITLKEKDRDS